MLTTGPAAIVSGNFDAAQRASWGGGSSSVPLIEYSDREYQAIFTVKKVTLESLAQGKAPSDSRRGLASVADGSVPLFVTDAKAPE